MTRLSQSTEDDEFPVAVRGKKMKWSLEGCYAIFGRRRAGRICGELSLLGQDLN